MKNYEYYLFNKPFNTLSQFSEKENKDTLAKYLKLKKDVYPVGRLDYDSEGLLLLTNDGKLHNLLLNPEFEHSRKYLVQVENIPTENSLKLLEDGVIIEGKKTKPAKVKLLENEPDIWERFPPIRYRKSIPTSWLEIELFEGRNRQVRKMTAKIGHPTLRLIRTHILFLDVWSLKPGEYRRLTQNEITKLKEIVYGKI